VPYRSYGARLLLLRVTAATRSLRNDGMPEEGPPAEPPEASRPLVVSFVCPLVRRRGHLGLLRQQAVASTTADATSTSFRFVERACSRGSSKATGSSIEWRSIRMPFARSVMARRPKAPSRSCVLGALPEADEGDVGAFPRRHCSDVLNLDLARDHLLPERGDDRRDERQAIRALVRDQHAQMRGLTMTHSAPTVESTAARISKFAARRPRLAGARVEVRPALTPRRTISSGSDTWPAWRVT
jgi:hypothetical protein